MFSFYLPVPVSEMNLFKEVAHLLQIESGRTAASNVHHLDGRSQSEDGDEPFFLFNGRAAATGAGGRPAGA
jgi:hypothetical protein